MEIELDNETKVIAILSGYLRELREGKDYIDTTYETAKTIIEICSTPEVTMRSELVSAFNWVSCIGEQFFDPTKSTNDMVDYYLNSKQEKIKLNDKN